MAQNNPKEQQPPRRVLVARFSALGDVVTSLPVLYSVCLNYPDTRFTMLTAARNESLFVNRPENLDIKGIDPAVLDSGIKGIWKLAGELAESINPDIFIDLHDDARSRVMRWRLRLKGIKSVTLTRVNKNEHALTRHTNKLMLPLLATRARYREAFFKCGLPVESRFDGIFGKNAKADPADFASITPPKGQNETWIGIAPFAAYPTKEYPLDKMQEVMETLLKDENTRVFIFGGPGRERQKAEEWARTHHRVTSLAGQGLSLGTELALMSHLDAMLTMDSANMHLASIVCTPTVSVWGATHFYCGFKGWRQGEGNMVQVPLSCRPCSMTGDKDCYRHDMLCLTAIRPETITKKVTDLLEKGKKQPKAQNE